VKLADGVEGTVSIQAGYDFTVTSDKGVVTPVEHGILVKLTAPKSCTKYHWLQFSKRIYTQAGGKLFKGPYPSNDKFKNLNDLYIDSDAVTDVYDEEQALVEHTGTTLAFPDLPDLDISADDARQGLTIKRFIGDDFLVDDDGNVYYHVHWERVGTLQADGTTKIEFENVGGEALSKPPAWAAALQYPSGFSDPEGKNPLPPYNNPMK